MGAGCARSGDKVRKCVALVVWFPCIRLTWPSFITQKGHYDRNHGPIPHLDAGTHIVRVDGKVRRPLTLSMKDIRDEYKQHEITSVLQCAGNRRHAMRTLLKEVNGIDWGDAALMCCRWKGARLKDILENAGVYVNADAEAHVVFSCRETKVQNAHWYEGSIELQRAMREDADVLVALEVLRKSRRLAPKR